MSAARRAPPDVWHRKALALELYLELGPPLLGRVTVCTYIVPKLRPMRFLSLLLAPAAVACVALAPGDTVAVIGASGNVGKLVALRLADTYNVRGVVRAADKVRPFLAAGAASLRTALVSPFLFFFFFFFSIFSDT